MADTIESASDTEIGGQLQAAGEDLARAGDRIASDFRDITSELFDAARDSVFMVLDEQRNRAADEIAGLAEVVRRSAEYARQHRGPMVSRYAEDAGELIGDFADGLRRRSIGELTGEVEAFARREPLLFVAAAIGVGLIAGRLLVSSSAHAAGPGTMTSASQNTGAGERRTAPRSVDAAVTSGVDMAERS